MKKVKILMPQKEMSMTTDNILGCTGCGGKCGKSSTGRQARPGSLINTPLATVSVEIPNSELIKLAAIVFAGVVAGNLISQNL